MHHNLLKASFFQVTVQSELIEVAVERPCDSNSAS